MELPDSPDDMPVSRCNDEDLVRMMRTLKKYSYASIDWGRDDHATQETGETRGEWTVAIYTGRRQITATHEGIENALWYVTEIAESHLGSVYDDKIKARAAALAKLTDEEKRLLGVL